MREEHYKALSQIVSLCRGDNCDDLDFVELISQPLTVLADLQLEGEDGERQRTPFYDEDGFESDFVTYEEDDIHRVFLLLQQKDAAYARLKKLYDIRLEVTREAVVSYNEKIASLQHQCSDLQAEVGELEAHVQWVEKHGPDPDVF